MKHIKQQSTMRQSLKTYSAWFQYSATTDEETNIEQLYMLILIGETLSYYN